MVPHLSNEFLSELNINSFSWPKIDKKFLIEENINVVVQFNGKKRGIIHTKKDISEIELVKEILILVNLYQLITFIQRNL